MPGPAPVPLEQRYDVDPITGCWIFTGSKNTEGYGNIRWRGRTVKAHRLAAHLWLGFDLADRACVLHSCDNPSCINPAHLRAGTKAENARDMVERRRQYVPRITGEKHWRAALSDADVAEIKRRRANGESQHALARAYGVQQSTISRIVNGKRRVV